MGERRPVRARGAAWASACAAWLDRRGVSPNAVSVASILFAAIGAAGFVVSSQLAVVPAALVLVSTPIWIALRSVCNLLDGMIAVEHGRGTRSGLVFNEFPDRVSDMILFVGAGFAISRYPFGIHLGWACAAAAVTTAYVRVLGASAGAEHDFRGPMAKPARMALLAVGSVAAGIERAVLGSTDALVVTLVLVLAGCLLTIARRLRRIITQLENTS